MKNLSAPWGIVRARADLNDVRVRDLRHSCTMYTSGGLLVGECLPMTGERLGHNHVHTMASYAHLADDPLKSAGNRIAGRLAEAVGQDGVAAAS